MENFFYMKQIASDLLQRFGVFVGGAIIGYWNQCPDGLQHLLYFLVILVIVDFILGATNAIRNGIFSSNGVKNSIIKFITYAAALLLGHGIDYGFGVGFAFQFAILLLIVTREGSSVIENLGKNGFILPGYIIDFLANKESEIMRHLPQEDLDKIYKKIKVDIVSDICSENTRTDKTEEETSDNAQAEKRDGGNGA